jgi:hypothetical protein
MKKKTLKSCPKEVKEFFKSFPYFSIKYNLKFSDNFDTNIDKISKDEERNNIYYQKNCFFNQFMNNFCGNEVLFFDEKYGETCRIIYRVIFNIKNINNN